MSRSFFAGFFTTLAFAIVIFAVLGAIFLLTSYISPSGIHVVGY